MAVKISKVKVVFGAFARHLTLATALVAGFAAYAQGGSAYFYPGNLVVSRSVYDNNPGNVQVNEMLPPRCDTTMAAAGSCVSATNNGSYPFVWNNALSDASFGITSKIFLDQVTPSGSLVTSLEVPNSSQNGAPPAKNQLVTSFSSKSELALNLSTDHNYLTFMGYVAPIDAVDVSNSNTPGEVDPTNPVRENVFRAVAQVDVKGKFRFTETNAYSGNNGRAAILNNTAGANFFYTAGNAGNGGNPQPNGIILGAGEQIISPEVKAEVAQNPGIPTPVGSFNITQLCDSADKIGKDTNFRGLTIFNNVVYTTKGSGGNGINTVYFIDTTGLACPVTPPPPATCASGGVGLPEASATLPIAGIPYDPSLLQSEGVVPYNMCVLSGFPTALKSKTSFPFGIWFANANTLYVADEGDGDNTYSTSKMIYTKAAVQRTAGLQKWIFDSTQQQWILAYTLQNGLALGTPYTIADYPTGNNVATGLPWAPATDGLRNVTGVVNGDSVTIYAITSTVSGNGDQGADPNKLVTITDSLSATSLPTGEIFTTVRAAGNLEVLRGVSFTPGT
ncbi:MAG TPA: hypothetical protein VGY99_24985 [Candidatus Binataceae bacterium]|nr:hypothetical protein [Candidatus Binataceae bacterium]